jgi:hypothetical protein
MTPFFHPAAEQELAAAMEIGEARGSGIGACLSIPRGCDRGRFPLRQGGADAVGLPIAKRGAANTQAAAVDGRAAVHAAPSNLVPSGRA